MKKTISFLIAAIILVSPFSVAFNGLVPEASAAEIDFSCGENATWSLDEYGTLRISGTGDMYDFMSETHYGAPWSDFTTSIKKVIIEEGITNISRNAFHRCYSAKELYIASTVEVIEESSLGYYGSNNFDIIIVAENSMLRAVYGNALTYTRWYERKLDYQPVYLGRMLYDYKGPPPDEYFSVDVKEGTVAISPLAFYNKKLGNITIPDSVTYIGANAFTGTKWLREQPVGPIYVGNAYIGYSGDIPLTETNFVLREGTTCVAGRAFKGSDRITSVTIPASVQSIGHTAFEMCKNLEEVIFEDGSNLKLIDIGAFNECENLERLELPESIEEIGYYAFRSTKIPQLHFPASLKKVGKGIAQTSSVKKITIDKDNNSLFVDKDSVVYGNDKKSLLFSLNAAGLEEYTILPECKKIWPEAFLRSKIKKVNFNEGLEYIDTEAFYFAGLESIHLPSTIKGYGLRAFSWCENNRSLTLAPGLKLVGDQIFSVNRNLAEVTFPESVEIIESRAFSGCFALEKAIIPANTTVSYEAFLNCENLTIYCFRDSSAHNYAVKYSFPFVLINEIVVDTQIKELLSQAANIDRGLYTEASLEILDKALEEVDLESDNLTQELIDKWCADIKSALSNLEYKLADFSSIDVLVKSTETIDRSLYTSASLVALDEALEAVEYGLTADKQSMIDEWAKAIENALDNLEYLPADYSEVEVQVSRAEKLDRRYYSELSLIALDAAVNSVDYGLDITEQERVNAFAKSIADAILALKYASVVLRHEPCGVIVSATTKEIKPDTLLSVEEVDPSNYEGTNFAVGGSIRSLHFYDINLVNNAAVIQPDGTVTVKIRIANGVDPNKCKVYHVTEDIVNPLVRFASTLDGNYIVFETGHFSEFAVIEVETVVDSIEVSQLPAKVEYGIGEQIDLTGLKVVASYSDGTSREISDYNVGMVTLNSVGKKKVSVYYTYGNITKTTEFEITVSGSRSTADITENGKAVERINKKLGLFALYTKASVQLDCIVKNADGCTVRWSSDNSRVVVDKNGKVTFKGLFGAKKAKVTAEVIDAEGNVIAKDTVTVLVYKLSFQFSDSISQTVDIFKRSFIC